MSTENEKPQETTSESTPEQVIQQPQTVVAPVAAQSIARTSIPITEWIITFFLLAIPILNIILLVIWSFSRDTNPSKANFAKAYLIILLVFFVLMALFVMLFGAAIWTFVQSQSGVLF